MNSFLKKKPLHCLLAAFLPLLLIYTQNGSAISIVHLVIPALYILIIALVSFFTCFFITGNKQGSFFFTTFTIISGFYFFRGIQYLISLIGSEYVRDVYCFACWMILELVVLWWIKKKPKAGIFIKSTSFLNIFFLALMAVKLFMFFFNSGRWNNLPTPGPEIQALENSKMIDSNKVNVYYFIMDECASSSTLDEVFKYKNGFDDSLRNLNFFVCRNARSLYGLTFASMSSTLNMERFNPDSISFKYYTHNLVTQMYEKQGYHTEMINSFFVKNIGKYVSDKIHDPYPFDLFENEINTAILVNTAFRIPYRTLFFNYGIDYHLKGIKSQFKMVDSIASSKSNEPRFLYVHINSPHGPLVMNAAGNPDYSYNKFRDSYLAQLIYTQQEVLQTVKKILVAEKGNCIILVQSDHGIRKEVTPVQLNNPRDMYKVFNAVYFPHPGGQGYFSDSMKIVNNFRAVFNYQFGSNLKMVN